MNKRLENKLTMYEGVLSLLRENDAKIKERANITESKLRKMRDTELASYGTARAIKDAGVRHRQEDVEPATAQARK